MRRYCKAELCVSTAASIEILLATYVYGGIDASENSTTGGIVDLLSA